MRPPTENAEMPDQTPKHPLASRTLWGALLVLLASGAQLSGLDLGDLSGLAEPIAALVGAGIAIYGRYQAKRPIATPRRRT